MRFYYRLLIKLIVIDKKETVLKIKPIIYG